MADLNQVRDLLPGVHDTVYLNIGTCGPMPTLAFEAMQVEARKDLTKGRIDAAHFPHLMALREQLRVAVAAGLHSDPAEIAVTSSTTDGLYAAIMGYRWQAGDELIISNIEHPSGLHPSFLAKRRFGIRVKVADVGLGGGDPAAIVRAFEEKVTPRTRMIMLSHVSYTTGATLPVKAITEMAHRHDVLVVVDAAQSYGALDLDIHDLGVDFYACPGQKWTCGPDGTGALYARAESVGDVEQTFDGSMIRDTLDYYGASIAPAFGAARFDSAGRNMALLAGQLAATSWVFQDLGMDWVAGRIRETAHLTYDALARLPGVTVVTPLEALSGLIAFTVDGIEPPELSRRLAEEHNVTIRYVTRYINNPDAARASVGFYTNEEDIARLIDGIQAIQRSL